MKKFLLSLALALGLVFSAPTSAQSVPESCQTVIISMDNLVVARLQGLTEAEVTKMYTEHLEAQGIRGQKEFKALQERIYAKIKEVYRLNPLTPEKYNAAAEAELALCLSIKGDYNKLKGV